jgi:hypothetical protein
MILDVGLKLLEEVKNTDPDNLERVVSVALTTHKALEIWLGLRPVPDVPADD